MNEWYKKTIKPPKATVSHSIEVLITDKVSVGIGVYNYDTSEWYAITPPLMRVVKWTHLPEVPK